MPLSIIREDLKAVSADAVVLPSNQYLQLSGGSGLEVAQLAGLSQLQAACDAVGFCAPGNAVATPAFAFSAQWLVHAVGPMWRGGEAEAEDRAVLRSAYDSALQVAAQRGAQSVALPLISSGSYECPASISLRLAMDAIRDFLDNHEDAAVTLVLFDREAMRASNSICLAVAEYIDDVYVDENAPSRYDFAGRLTSLFKRETVEVRQMRVEEDAALSDLSPDDVAFEELRTAHDAEPEAREACVKTASMAAPVENLEDLLANLDASFSTTLMQLIDARHLKDSQVYKRANLSRQHFSKIRSDANYRPTKRTALSLCIALELSLEETRDLLSRAGFALTHTSKSDIIVEYFILNANYDIFEINETLYAFDQPLLGA
ncbi:MAG: macro domain-containing protein [Coriobacteriia bacterium]|nr:macro domain-containing protein [Coriobacteriia bacterium]